jgi:hypothetical protein
MHLQLAELAKTILILFLGQQIAQEMGMQVTCRHIKLFTVEKELHKT